MSTAKPQLLVLLATGLLIGLGGVLWATEASFPANAAWTMGSLIPLTLLIRSTVNSMRHGKVGVDVIALLAIGGALALGEYLTAGVIGLMLASGQYLDAYAAGRAERELTALLRHAPVIARVVRSGGIVTVDVTDVVIGDRLVVGTGEVLPVDGVVATPSAVLDESALTGEAVPVQRKQGDLVPSGAVNAGGTFDMVATAAAEASTYAGIVRLVQEARRSRAPAVRLADRWAGWFVPLTLTVAGAAWALSADPVRGLAVLVVATPCPLLLAVPVAIASGVSRGARRGIIFRGGAPLELLAGAENVVLDKTGTLTVGEPRLRSVHMLSPDVPEDEALRAAASVDQTSGHVLAKAVVGEARRRRLDMSIPSEVNEFPGDGVSGRVDGRLVSIGRLEWILGRSKEPETVRRFRRHMARLAPLTTFVAIDAEPVAALQFDDAIRPDAAAAIRALRRSGVRRVIMATGDHPVVAQSVGLALGVDEVHAEATPQDKIDTVRQLSSEGTTVMVGDGINDAPALAAAHVGVAMGARGATASSEAASVVLMVDRLQRLIEGMQIAQRSRRIATQSVVLGMGLSLLAMGVASVGLLPPIAGAITQEFIDVVAIGNALRALRGDHRVARRQALPPELAEVLRREHDHLMPRLDLLQETADRLDRVPPVRARSELQQVLEFLVEVIIPHERQDEHEVYPALAELLDGDDPLASMSRSHREIFHLIDNFRRLMAEVPPDGPDAGDLRDLRRILYGLHAVLRLHFDQEEELYRSLDENYGVHATTGVGSGAAGAQPPSSHVVRTKAQGARYVPHPRHKQE